MNSKISQIGNYRKYLLNRNTTSPLISAYIENYLSSEDEAVNYSFHKVMIHNWPENDASLFDALSDFYQVMFVPVNFQEQNQIASFYTCSLSLILKIMKNDFLFPHQRNMFNIDILFNDKNSGDLFNGKTTIDEIVTGVVSKRFSETCELDLSNFCEDKEFKEQQINFYKVGLLSHFKILMLRMGRDTKSINLSNNNLRQLPTEVLNFFTKGDMTVLNLSNNYIQSISEMTRLSSKIEKLWLEGNPLCDELDAITYVKQIIMKYPRITELDGIKLNRYGTTVPFVKNFIVNPGQKIKMLIEKFLMLYFTHYDSRPRTKIGSFYDNNATLSISFRKDDSKKFAHFEQYGRNFQDKFRRDYNVKNDLSHKIYNSKEKLLGVLCNLPPTVHDPTTFTVDVVRHDKKCIVFTVDGIFKELDPKFDLHLHFRRTFVLQVQSSQTMANSYYFISNDLFYVTSATQEQIENSFKHPLRNLNSIELQDPEPDQSEIICNAFVHTTKLKRSEAVARLEKHKWDMRQALKEFMTNVRNMEVRRDNFEFHDLDDVSDDGIN